MKLKKLLLVVLSLSAMVCMAFGLAACGEEEHEHNLRLTPAREATCGTAGNSKYYTCSGCGKYFSDENALTEIEENAWVIEATGKHTAGTAWKSDATGHWHECTGCGTKMDEASHDDDPCSSCNYTAQGNEDDPVNNHVHNLVEHAAVAASCSDGNTLYYSCEDKGDEKGCGKYFSDADGYTEITKSDWLIPAMFSHTPGTAFHNDETSHWKECIYCGNELNKGDHEETWVNGGTQHWKSCQVCNAELSDKAEHKKAEDSEYAKNVDGHTYACEVCGISIAEAHSGTVTQLTEGDTNAYHQITCTICGYVGQEAHKPMPGSDEATMDTCRFECECGLVVDGRHRFGYVALDDKVHTQICTVCGFELGGENEHEFLGHANSDNWYSDDTGHWAKCYYCGYADLSTKESHAETEWDSTNSEYHTKRCQICGSDYAKEPHQMGKVYNYNLKGHWSACADCGRTESSHTSHTYDANKQCQCGFALVATEGLEIEDGILYGIGTVDPSEVKIIIVPDTVTEIAANAFHTTGQYSDAAPRFTEIYIPASVTAIRSIGRIDYEAQGAFSYQKYLETVIIAGGPVIEEDAFWNCTNLSYVEVGDGTVIKKKAFGGGKKYLTITMGKNVTMESECFGAISSITFKGTVAEWQEIVEKTPSDFSTSNFTVYCTDGVSDKEGKRNG